MGLNPGEIRIIDPDDIAEMFMMTTHNMPLNYLKMCIRDSGWVPQAHANASAPAAALFSTVVMKIGLLGILTLSLLGGNAPRWCCLLYTSRCV